MNAHAQLLLPALGRPPPARPPHLQSKMASAKFPSMPVDVKVDFLRPTVSAGAIINASVQCHACCCAL